MDRILVIMILQTCKQSTLYDKQKNYAWMLRFDLSHIESKNPTGTENTST